MRAMEDDFQNVSMKSLRKRVNTSWDEIAQRTGIDHSEKETSGDIKKLSPVEQTTKLEAQHKVVYQFAPKFYSFSYRVMEKKLYHAALHTLCNADKKQNVTKDGVPQFKVSYPKYKAGLHVVKPVTEALVYVQGQEFEDHTDS